jgi:hypothetical protein
MSDGWKYRAIREMELKEQKNIERIESRKDIKVSKTKADGEHLYINILGFKNEEDWDVLYTHIRVMVRDWAGKQND